MSFPISDVLRRVVYSGSAGLGPYSFSFEILAVTDIEVYKNSTLLTLTTDYTVSISGSGTGSVTLVVAATGDDNITLVGSRAIERTTDFVTGGDLFANTLNQELDSVVIFAQQVDEKADRGLKAPITDPTDINMELPVKATRRGKVLAFDETSGDPVAGPDLSAMTTVIAQSANINTVAANIASVNTVAGNTSNVNTVAGISGNVTTVAGVAANVTTVAGVSADVTTVAGSIANVNAVGTNIAAVVAVDANETNINAVEANEANIDTVAGIAANVTTVAGVAANVTTVAGVSANVTTVAGISADVTAVATNNANVSTVATNIASVNTAAGDIAAIIEVANDLNEAVSEIEVVANNIASVDTVGTNIANVNTVAGISADVSTVAADSADIQLLADNIATISEKVNKSGDTMTGDLIINTTGALTLPDGTTGQRPSAASGMVRLNNDTSQFEGYNGTAWGQLGGGATGGGSDAVFVENDQAVTANYTIPGDKNALSTGPITINDGVTVTVSDGARYIVL